MPSQLNPSRPLWWSIALQVWRRHLLLKTAGVTVFLVLFFIAYFHLLRHPSQTVLVMPTTRLDGLIPFLPGMLGFYLSLWLYVGIPVHLTASFGNLVRYGALSTVLCLGGLSCFYLWPTTVPPAHIDTALNPAFLTLQHIDAGGNACPSLHVASAAFSCYFIFRALRNFGAGWPWQAANILWCTAIVLSTVMTRQHVVLDALAGLALAALVCLASRRWHPRIIP